MAGGDVECGIAMGPGQSGRLPGTEEGRLLDWPERAQAHMRAKVDQSPAMVTSWTLAPGVATPWIRPES